MKNKNLDIKFFIIVIAIALILVLSIANVFYGCILNKREITVDSNTLQTNLKISDSYLFSNSYNQTKLTFAINIKDSQNNLYSENTGNITLTDNENNSQIITNQTSIYINQNNYYFITIDTDEKFKVIDILLSNNENNQSRSILNRLNQNQLIINKALVSDMEGDVTLNIILQKKLWTDEENRTVSLVGSGTENRKYFIRNAREMAFVSYAVNNGLENVDGVKYSQAVYQVVEDIDLNGNYWQPIGNQEFPFEGKFYIGNYKIYNICLDRFYDTKEYGGLFGNIGSDAIISKNNVFLIYVFMLILIIVLLAILLYLILKIPEIYRTRKIEKLSM